MSDTAAADRAIEDRMKVEIIVEGPVASRVRTLLAERGVDGFTVFPVLGGQGRHGEWPTIDVTSALATQMIVIVETETKARGLAAAAGKLLRNHAALIMISRVEVIGVT
jgi:nitrogen regulatory protein PII